MTVAIVVASKHGSTREIAEEVARCLRHQGIGSTLYDAGDAVDLSGRTGAIIGSAIYMGKWLEEARSFIDEHQQELQRLPVWLFSSGPIGVVPKGQMIDEHMLSDLVSVSGAREHRTFHGKLDPDQLNFSEKLITRIVHAPEGDFRDFEAIDGWAEEIARALQTENVRE